MCDFIYHRYHHNDPYNNHLLLHATVVSYIWFKCALFFFLSFGTWWVTEMLHKITSVHCRRHQNGAQRFSFNKIRKQWIYSKLWVILHKCAWGCIHFQQSPFGWWSILSVEICYFISCAIFALASYVEQLLLTFSWGEGTQPVKILKYKTIYLFILWSFYIFHT